MQMLPANAPRPEAAALLTGCPRQQHAAPRACQLHTERCLTSICRRSGILCRAKEPAVSQLQPCRVAGAQSAAPLWEKHEPAGSSSLRCKHKWLCQSSMNNSMSGTLLTTPKPSGGHDAAAACVCALQRRASFSASEDQGAAHGGQGAVCNTPDASRSDQRCCRTSSA